MIGTRKIYPKIKITRHLGSPTFRLVVMRSKSLEFCGIHLYMNKNEKEKRREIIDK